MRLHYYVCNPDVSIRFENRDYFTVGDESGYRTLSNLAEKMLTALSLCVLDNECINVRYCRNISNRAKLQKLIQQAQVAGAATDGDEEEDGTISPEEAEKRAREQNALFDLINYITAVLARLMSQIGAGKFFQATVLGALVRRVAKIKLLLLDLPSNARVAAQNGESVLDQSRVVDPRAAESIIDEEEECEEALRVIEANARDGLTSQAEAEMAAYCIRQNKYRSGVSSAWRYIAVSLRFLNRSGLPPTAYEICGLVYETGFQGFKVSLSFFLQYFFWLPSNVGRIAKTLLYQDRDMEYCATSDLDNLNTADCAFHILEATVRNLKQLRKTGDPSNAVTERKVKTFIEWKYQVLDSDSSKCDPDHDRTPLASLELEYMDDIITVMVALAATNPCLLADLTDFRSIMLLSYAGVDEDLARPYRETNFKAFFRLFTDKMEAYTRSEGVMRLSAAFENGTFDRCRLIDRSNEGHTPSDVSRKFGKLTQWMEEEWVVDETSVIVPCTFYVISTAALSLLLAGGGLAIGFTVGNRIKGVDPFNIATYAWVLAAFLILICKSVLVSEWSWSDFLHCRVRCRSVSELEAVTGIRDQLIIAKLLHDESGGGILFTRGPYNSIFRRRSKDSGFSIDRPISTTTMLMSGLTPLKVVTPRGHALVCLDARRGTQLRVVNHMAEREEEYLVCEDLNRTQKLAMERSGEGRCTRLHLLGSKQMKWKRVMGVYDARNVVFV